MCTILGMKRKCTVITLVSVILFCGPGIIKLIYREKYSPTACLFFEILNETSVFASLPAPLSRGAVLLSLIPDIPFNLLFYFYTALSILVRHGPMGVLNPGGTEPPISDLTIGILSLVTIPVVVCFTCWLVRKKRRSC